MKLKGYDAWKLDNPYEYECVICDHCECEFQNEDDIEEICWYDADHDKQWAFLCEYCREKVGG